MQQYYPTNIDDDPTRLDNIRSKDLLPKKNVFNMIKNNNTNTFNTSTNEQQPDLYRENIFTDNFNRNDGLNEEMIEKDKKIQELEFKIKQMEIENDTIKSKLNSIKEYEKEIQSLSYKLTKEYEKNKEIQDLKNKLSLFEKNKKEDNKLINELKKKLNANDEEILFNDMKDINDLNGDDEGIKEIDYDEIYKKTLEAENNRKIYLERYKNDKLKTIISKYVTGINDNKIDDIFITLKINENTEITKELISRIIFEIKQ